MKRPNAADFISCDCEGTRMTESEDLAFSTLEVDHAPIDQSTDRAERIVRRLNINNRQMAYNQLDRKSKIGGILVTLVFVGWWLFIGINGDSEGGTSVFFALDFSQVALTVMALSACSSLLSELSKDRGAIYASSLSGGMMIIAVLYVLEPLAGAVLMEDFLTVSEGMSRTFRLAALWGGMTYGANLLVNAFLLTWLLKVTDAHGWEIDNQSANAEHDALLED